MISILCTDSNSNYNLIPGLDLWPSERDAFNFSGQNMVIAHPPCPQWSRLKSFASSNLKEKLLAEWCYDIVMQNGGIFEHPAGSSFFKYINAPRSQILSVDQCWFGFPARKRTYLLFNQCRHIPFPLFTLPSVRELYYLPKDMRSRSTLSFNIWLVNSVCRTNFR